MKLLRCLLVALFASLSLLAQTNFRIGSWNLEFLGADPSFRRDTPPRDDDDYAAIGKKLVELGLCVVAVQEINGEAPLLQVAAGAGPAWRVLLGTSGGWDDGKTAQNIGFVYDSAAVELLQAEELLQLPRKVDDVPIFHRVPVTACFRHKATGCDFRLVTVHLKAGQKDPDAVKRKLEATQLGLWLEGLRRDAHEDGDVFVLGDFNCNYDSEPPRLLAANGALADLRGAAPKASILHFDETIDHILAAAACAEADPRSFTVHAVDGAAARQAWRKTYSDHFPVSVTLLANGDDDPGAAFTIGAPEQRLPLSRRPALAATQSPSPAAINLVPAGQWPLAVGARIELETIDASRSYSGRLLAPLPVGPGGWVVIDGPDGRLAFPFERIRLLRLP